MRGSLGVVLPEEIIDRLQIREGNFLSLIEAPEGACRLILSHDPASGNALAQADDIINRFPNTLRILSE